jgi:5-methylcytosine-specific restriction endonuclease McrA
MPQVLGRRRTTAPVRVQAPLPKRENTASRGYDHLWRKVSERHRRKHPFCEMCRQEGRQRLCDAVDHKIPIDDGGDRLKAENLWSICDSHHNGPKRAMEAYARERGLIYLLPLWCDDPAERPKQFRGTAACRR